jgi:hypothetical protein
MPIIAGALAVALEEAVSGMKGLSVWVLLAAPAQFDLHGRPAVFPGGTGEFHTT